MSRSVLIPAAITAAVVATAVPSWAHVTLETKEAVVSSTYKAVFRVPHGCGAAATTAIRVRFPDGTLSPKPMPHAGWTLTIQEGTLAKPITAGNDTVTKGVTEIAWTGGKLADNEYDEFVIQLTTPAEAGTVLFPLVQECEGGKANRWILAPGVAAQTGPNGEEISAAPSLKLNPKP